MNMIWLLLPIPVLGVLVLILAGLAEVARRMDAAHVELGQLNSIWDDFDYNPQQDSYRHPETDVSILGEDMPTELLPYNPRHGKGR